MDQDTVFEVVAQAAGEDGFFDVLAVAHHVLRGVRMIDADDILLDDGALIELRGNVVAGGSDQFDPALVGLVIGLGAYEAGQEAVMYVEYPARVGAAQIRRKDLHVARQHHGVAVRLLEQALHLGVGLCLVVRRRA